MKSKIIALTFGILIIAPLTVAQIAVVPEKTSKNIEGLETEFELGLVNLEDSSKNVTIEVQYPEDLNVSHPSQITLEPAGPVQDDANAEWYRVSQGRYAKIHYIDIPISIDSEASSRRHSFSLSAETVSRPDIQRPRLAEVRQVNYEVFSSSPLIQAGFEYGPETSQSEEESNRSEKKERPENSSEKEPKNESSKQDNVSSEVAEGFDNVTLLLLLAIILTSWYAVSEAFK